MAAIVTDAGFQRSASQSFWDGAPSLMADLGILEKWSGEPPNSASYFRVMCVCVHVSV